MKKYLILFAVLACSSLKILMAQEVVVEAITLNNGNIIFAEIQWLEDNRLKIKSPSGHSSWEVKWTSVAGIQSPRNFKITTQEGDNFVGKMTRSDSGLLIISTTDGDSVQKKLSEIIGIRPMYEGFAARTEIYLSGGFSRGSARNLVNLNLKGGIEYSAKRSILNLDYSAFLSTQQNSTNLSRDHLVIEYHHRLPKLFYGYALSSGLSNTEQNIDLRWLLQGGFGKWIFATNKLYWGIFAGLNHNFENFSTEVENFNTWEGLIGTELDLYNIGDFKLKTTLRTYPGISAGGRFRSDLAFKLKYTFKYLEKSKLINKIFIEVGLVGNYDSRPATDAPKLDHVFSTSIGFSWNE